MASQITGGKNSNGNSTTCSTTHSGQQKRKISKPSLVLCVGNPLAIGGFPSQRASNMETFFPYHDIMILLFCGHKAYMLKCSYVGTIMVLFWITKISPRQPAMQQMWDQMCRNFSSHASLSNLFGTNHAWYIDGLVHERRNSIANAMELRLSCTNPSICMKLAYQGPLCMQKYFCYETRKQEMKLCIFFTKRPPFQPLHL